MTELADAVAGVVGRLGSPHIATLAAAYHSVGAISPASAAKVAQSVPAPHRAEVDRLNRAWAKTPALPGAAIAIALEAALSAVALIDHPEVQVVVTGPDSPAVPVRLTSEVVSQLIERATARVMLVSFAAYQVTGIVRALDAAATRGIAVALVLESSEKLEGGGGASAYAAHAVYEWPPDRREPPSAKLHAKAVIVDSRDVLLTSANMTNAAYDANIELGVLCRGGGVAAQIQKHFDGLIATGVLVRIPGAAALG